MLKHQLGRGVSVTTMRDEKVTVDPGARPEGGARGGGRSLGTACQ